MTCMAHHQDSNKCGQHNIKHMRSCIHDGDFFVSVFRVCVWVCVWVVSGFVSACLCLGLRPFVCRVHVCVLCLCLGLRAL